MSLQWKSNYWKLLLLTVSDNLLIFWVNSSDYNWFEITETKKYILKYKYKKEIAQRSAFSVHAQYKSFSDTTFSHSS